MSLFDFAAFQQPAQAEGTAQPSIFPHPALPQQVIDEALCIGANDQNSRLIICAYFKRISRTMPGSWQSTMERTALAFIWMADSMPSGTTPRESALPRAKAPSVPAPPSSPGNRRRPVSGNCWTWAGICPRASWTGWTGMNASNGPRSYGISGRILQKAPPTRAIFPR